MAMSKTLTLTLFLLSTLALAVKSQDIHQILPAYNLPSGLFPDVNNQVSVESNGQIFVNLGSDCFVRLPSTGTLLHYKNKVTGVISFGRIENIRGIQMQREANTWVPVTGVRFNIVEGKMEFHLGGLSELLPMDDFQKVSQCQSSGFLKFRGIPFTKLPCSVCNNRNGWFSNTTHLQMGFDVLERGFPETAVENCKVFLFASPKYQVPPIRVSKV